MNAGSSLPNFHQFVNVPTRKDRTFDLCYYNVTEAYPVRRLPPPGSSDHCMLQMLPLYRQKSRREKANRIQVKKRDADSVDTLKGCIDCTDWDVFIKSSANINEATNVISGYITFCEELCIPVKQIKCFPNNKPWVNSEMKNLVCQKKDIWKIGNDCQWKDVKRKVKATIKQKKDHYRVTLENQFASGKTKQMWYGMQMITGYKEEKK